MHTGAYTHTKTRANVAVQCSLSPSKLRLSSGTPSSHCCVGPSVSLTHALPLLALRYSARDSLMMRHHQVVRGQVTSSRRVARAMQRTDACVRVCMCASECVCACVLLTVPWCMHTLLQSLCAAHSTPLTLFSHWRWRAGGWRFCSGSWKRVRVLVPIRVCRRPPRRRRRCRSCHWCDARWKGFCLRTVDKVRSFAQSTLEIASIRCDIATYSRPSFASQSSRLLRVALDSA